MSTLHEVIERPELEAPALVLCLDGWVDAGVGAANARAALVLSGESITVARFDTEALLDYRSRRPAMHIVDGVLAGFTWPSTELWAGTDLDGKDMLVLVGAEPDRSWQRFSEDVVELAMAMGARMVVGLGAYATPVPHTRPVRMAVAAADPALAGAGTVRTTVDVPSGIQSVIEHVAYKAGLPAVGLWAQVPHYVSAMAYPAASVALLDSLAAVAELRIDKTELERQANVTKERVDRLVADNEEYGQIVGQLEAAYDNEEADQSGLGAISGPLPSGDELAAEVERYLREQDD